MLMAPPQGGCRRGGEKHLDLSYIVSAEWYCLIHRVEKGKVKFKGPHLLTPVVLLNLETRVSAESENTVQRLKEIVKVWKTAKEKKQQNKVYFKN